MSAARNMVQVQIDETPLTQGHLHLLRHCRNGAAMFDRGAAGVYLCESVDGTVLCMRVNPDETARDLVRIGAIARRPGEACLRITPKGERIIKIFALNEAARHAVCA